MSEGPKDQKGRCPASKQVISCLMALKQHVYVFLLSQRQSREIPAETEFRKDNTCAQLDFGSTNVLSGPFMVNFNPHQLTNLHYSPGYPVSVWGWLVVTLWLEDFFRKTRCLRPRSRLLTGLLNITSQSSHQQSLQLPQEKQKRATKGRDEVSRVKY